MMDSAIGSEDRFVAQYGEVFEHSPWVARAAFRQLGEKPATAGELEQVFREVIEQAEEDQQLALLRAHPELACAERDALTAASRDEQAGCGLDRCSPAEFAEFQQLNAAYRARFGFPFIVAVAGLTRAEILEQFRARLENEPGEERREALAQVCRIGALRLARMNHGPA